MAATNLNDIKTRVTATLGRGEEDKVTRSIEDVTTKAPSVSFLGLAVGSMAISALAYIFGKKEFANFVGLWAPSILVCGLYNKLVKVEHEIAPSSTVH